MGQCGDYGDDTEVCFSLTIRASIVVGALLWSHSTGGGLKERKTAVNEATAVRTATLGVRSSRAESERQSEDAEPPGV